ncbi:alpha-1,3-arabinosyltransferase XAT2-like [Musa acuminata AAA Group]|uniref:alpha-1,3-arabinosyltransferase XAT2-like n=1 Tax=Musa acuminata AAA Group TaxID=214697 RepID=UPI0031CF8A1D
MGSQAKLLRSFTRVEPQTLSFVIFAGCFLISMALLAGSAGSLVSLPSLSSWLSAHTTPPVSGSQENPGPQHPHPEDGTDRNEEPQRKPLCDTSDRRADICDMEGDVRVRATSSSIFFVTSSDRNASELQQSWRIKPHPRKGDHAALSRLTELSVGYSTTHHEDVPKCDVKSSVPAIIFATGGYMGNFFHETTDLVVPLYITSQKFDGEVQFLISDMLPWWIAKYELLLKKLSRYEIIDFNRDPLVRCYPRVIVGITFHKDMSIDPARSGGVTMFDFGRFIRSAYSLERETAIVLGEKQEEKKKKKPRLVIIARKSTRKFSNVDEIARMAEWQGFEPVIAEIKKNQSLGEFARVVNSCDAMMGVHGAGLTNLIFLPTNAVVIQVVPLGGLETYCWSDYGVPALEMKMRYLQYSISVTESSLVDRYGITDPAITNPQAILAQKDGWRNWTSIYFFNQDVRLDVSRFSSILVHARQLLHR